MCMYNLIGIEPHFQLDSESVGLVGRVVTYLTTNVADRVRFPKQKSGDMYSPDSITRSVSVYGFQCVASNATSS